jgi:hypothetical protein
MNYTKGTFGYDITFLKEHKDVVTLENGHAMVAVVGDYQGRVMTSSSKGMVGQSYGWVNHEAVAQKEYSPQINVYGGEDRFWLGPEGGQFSVYFDPGVSFDFTNWRVPSCIDTDPMILVERNATSAHFTGHMQVKNYKGFEFQLQVDRLIRLYDKTDIECLLGVEIKNLSYVAYESLSSMTNIGGEAWSKKKGLLSVWILGMFNPGDDAVIVMPFRGGKSAHQYVKDDYFGTISSDRLVKGDKAVFLKADGKSRGKIGIPPAIAVNRMGSYDPSSQVLTITLFDFSGEEHDYVNAAWEIQDNPFSGDVANAYNDGPVNDAGEQLGPFYELESCSPARALKRGEAIRHSHRTFHFEGDKESLNAIASRVLGVSLDTHFCF